MNVIGFSGLHHSASFKKRSFPSLSARELRFCQGFDSAAAIVTRDGVKAAAAEERFTGEKKTGAFPVNAIRYCLDAESLAPEDVDLVAHGFAYKPYEELFLADPFGRQQYAEVYSREVQIACLAEHFPTIDWEKRLVTVPHHLAHAASAFYLSGFDEALILVSDGMGEVHSATVSIGSPSGIRIIATVPSLHSLGMLYGIFTHYLGFTQGIDEYKVMGLAPYGDARRYISELMPLVQLKEEGNYTVPILLLGRSVEEKESYSLTLREITNIFGEARVPGSAIEQRHKDIAAALQSVLQTALLHQLRHFKTKTGQQSLCLAGGVALNCTANGVIKRSRMFDGLFVQPASGDDGTALGAALFVQRHRDPVFVSTRMPMPYWGPDYDRAEIEEALRSNPGYDAAAFDSFEQLAEEVATRLSQGQIVACFRGRMEFGPRALGNRSILADPRDPEMRDRINALIKKRESFRPFAPVVTTEAASQFFDIQGGEEELFAHMLFVTQVKQPYRNQLPAITHVDGSARVQVVSRQQNEHLWTLVHVFGKRTGVPILLNTSFNTAGQPIVCTPSEGLSSFRRAKLDALILGDLLVTRTED